MHAYMVFIVRYIKPFKIDIIINNKCIFFLTCLQERKKTSVYTVDK